MSGSAPLIRTGLCSITFRALPAERVAALAAEEALDAVEWGGDVHVPAGEMATARRVRRWCEDSGICPASYGSYVTVGAQPGDRPVAAATRQEPMAALDTAHELGADNIRVWAGSRPSSRTSPSERSRAADELAALASAARERELTVSLEFHAGTLTDRVASTLALLEQVDDPAVFTYWQPPERTARSQRLAMVDQLAPRLSHLHVFAWRDFLNRFPLQRDEQLWLAVLRRLTDRPGAWQGPRYAFIEYVRHDDPYQFRRDARTLRGWLSST